MSASAVRTQKWRQRGGASGTLRALAVPRTSDMNSYNRSAWELNRDAGSNVCSSGSDVSSSYVCRSESVNSFNSRAGMPGMAPPRGLALQNAARAPSRRHTARSAARAHRDGAAIAPVHRSCATRGLLPVAHVCVGAPSVDTPRAVVCHCDAAEAWQRDCTGPVAAVRATTTCWCADQLTLPTRRAKATLRRAAMLSSPLCNARTSGDRTLRLRRQTRRDCSDSLNLVVLLPFRSTPRTWTRSLSLAVRRF